MHNEELHSENSPNEEAHSEEAHSIVGIRFEPCGKVYCFKANGLGLKRGERVVVESELGMSIGRVVIEDYTREDPEKELKPVLRRVSDEDLRKEEENNGLKKEAFDFCSERIMARGLAMKLLGTDVTLDRRRIIFFFSAETRIDFRELVKDLAAKFRTRIELRQVGVRDAARITGGIGICGRELCCRRFLTSFEPISIKMAKKQELALNTSKLSGICGRLMCCLGYEYDEELVREKAKERAVGEKPPVEEAAPLEVPVEEKPPVSATVVEAPAQEPAPAAEKRRSRRRRPRGRKKPRPEKPGGEKPQEAAQEQKPEEKEPVKTAEKKPPKKPFKRKRRRRMKGKKKE